MFLERLRLTLEMIKFEHSIFALPFALTATLMAYRDNGMDMTGVGWTLTWIIVAMVAARSAAMAFNRVVDASIDARNPRTRLRQIPAGQLSKGFAWGFTAAASLIFVLAAGALNPLCLKLSPAALALVFFYSFTKRFTHFSHLVLGLALGIAPAAAWIAVRGELDRRILLLSLAVTFWTAGFDVIYSCQDYEFDCDNGLFSVPTLFGVAGALRVALALHALMIVCLVLFLRMMDMGEVSMYGLVIVTAVLLYEHSIVKPNDLSRVDAAFFTLNGWVSVLFFAFCAGEVILELL